MEIPGRRGSNCSNRQHTNGAGVAAAKVEEASIDVSAIPFNENAHVEKKYVYLYVRCKANNIEVRILPAA